MSVSTRCKEYELKEKNEVQGDGLQDGDVRTVVNHCCGAGSAAPDLDTSVTTSAAPTLKCAVRAAFIYDTGPPYTGSTTCVQFQIA